jgi:tetratricopeptide (TPR) repeat protein
MAVQPAGSPLALARRYLETGDARRALSALEQAPGAVDDPDFWAVRAEALYELGRFAEAAEAAGQGLGHDPEDLGLLDLLAIAELERGREKEAAAAIDAALELYPDSAELHAHRALILARRKRKSFRVQSFKKARAALDEALRLDPQSEDVLRARAQVAALSGDPLAPAYAAELLALEPDDEQAHALTGTALANRGNVLPALGHFEEAARLNPSDPKLAWAGRYARELRRPFFAPVLFLERITRGHVRIGWFVIAFPTLRLHVLWLSVLVFAFWAYMWAVHIYLHRRFGKEPE